MKTIIKLIFIVSVLSSTHLRAQTNELKIPFSSTTAAKSLSLDLFNGQVSIIGTNRSDILLKYRAIEDENIDPEEYDKNAKGLKKIANANSLSFEITEDNNRVELKTQNWMNEIDLVMEVPTAITINISKNIGESIMIKNIIGNINVETNVGDVVVEQVTGVVNASSNTGDVEVVFNSIPEMKNMIFSSTTGNIDLTLPASIKANLKMRTEWGDIYTDLDLVTSSDKPKVNTTKENGKTIIATDAWTKATLNGGGPEFSIKTRMGDIYLRQK